MNRRRRTKEFESSLKSNILIIIIIFIFLILITNIITFKVASNIKLNKLEINELEDNELEKNELEENETKEKDFFINEYNESIFDIPYTIDRQQKVTIEYYSENYFIIKFLNESTQKIQELNLSVFDIMRDYYSVSFEVNEFDEYGRPIRPPATSQGFNYTQYVCIVPDNAVSFSCLEANLIG
jgi:hypothetical protein